MKILVWIADHAAIISLIAVIVAVLIKFEQRMPKRLNRWLFHIDITILVSAFLLGVLKDHLDSVWQENMERKVSESRKLAEVASVSMMEAVNNAEKAKERAETLSKEIATERVRYAELEQRASQLEEASKDRVITDADHARFIIHTNHLPKCKVSIKYLMGNNGEPHRFAQQLAKLVHDAGFHLAKETMLSFLTTGDVAGVILKIKDVTNPPPATAVIQKALGSISIEAPAAPEDKAFPIEDDEVRIYVYRK